MRLSLLPALIAASVFANGCVFVSIPLEFPTLNYNEVTLERGKGQKILVLDIDGVITGGSRGPGGFFQRPDSTVIQVDEKLSLARRDKRIGAVVVRMNTPGGGVTASDTVYRLLADYREETGVPVFVSMLDIATSGGYYIAMAADEIYAQPTTITGSIGVIALFPQLENLGNKIGVYFEVIESGENKNIGGGFRNMQPSQRAILQDTINELYETFLTVVIDGRPRLNPETIRELADGRIYTAQQAADNGLIDGVAYLSEVIDLAKRRIGNPKAPVFLYRQTTARGFNSFYAETEVDDQLQTRTFDGATINLINVEMGNPALRETGSVFNFLWVP